MIEGRRRGDSFKQIAYALGIAVGTATKIGSNARRKLGASAYANRGRKPLA